MRKISIAVFAVAAMLLIFAGSHTPQKVFADGGVGSGGSGSGGTSGGPWGWTIYGHGWAMYGISSGGPTAGFHTGSWSTIRNTCQAAHASKVAIYILGTGTGAVGGGNGRYMGYDDVGYSGKWGGGGSVDSGRATKISAATAHGYFNQLGTYGVNTSGYTWGSNVGWFCWDFDVSWDLDGSATIDGHTGTISGDRGTTHTFNFKVTKTGAAANNIDIAEAWTSGNSGNIQTWNNRDFGPNFDDNYNFTIPANAPRGATYCARVTYDPKSWDNNNTGHSNTVCIKAESPPTGSITSATCSSITGTAFDRDITSSQVLRIKITIDGATVKYANSAAGGGNWSFNGVLVDYESHTYNVTILGKNDSNVEDGNNLNLGNRTIGPCAAPPTCGSVSLSPSSPEPLQPFDGRVSISYSLSSGATLPSSPGYTFHVTGTAFGTHTVNVDSSAAATNLSHASSVLIHSAGHPVGDYDISWQFYKGATPLGPVCSGGVPVTARPYFKVFNGDVNAAASFDNCATHAGIIKAYNKGNTGAGDKYAGSSAQVAAFAGGLIDQFASSSLQPSPLTAPVLLSFADSPGYGGNYGCLTEPDYWDSSAAVLTGAQDITSPTASKVYVDGNVYIKNDISLGDGPWAVGSVPTYTLVVKGNIYIDPSVSRIDGAYITLNGGNIYTCAPTDHVTAVTPTWVKGNCDSQLHVNGSLMAEGAIKMLRLQGTLFNSVQSEGTGTATAAEVFTYSPDVWLQELNEDNDPSSTGPVNSYISLPPVL